MSEHILVGIDFDRTYERTFETAMQLARAWNAVLDLVHVATPIPFEGAVAEDGSAYAAEAEGKLRGLAAIAEQRGLTAQTHVIAESVVFGMLQAIAEIDPRL